MAKIETVVCDVCEADISDGGKSGVALSIDGQSWTLDLCAAHRDELTNSAAWWGEHGRKGKGTQSTTARKRSGGSRGGRTNAVDTKAVREWARAEGYEVPTRGRLSADLVEAYTAATGRRKR